jgi:hypothetical protein
MHRLGRRLPIPVLAKCEHLNPCGSVKDRIAEAIISNAEARHALRPRMTIVEAAAGNTGVGLALPRDRHRTRDSGAVRRPGRRVRRRGDVDAGDFASFRSRFGSAV